MLKIIRRLLPHVTIVLSGMYAVFFFIDKVNSAMAFINNNITKFLLFILCIATVVNSCIMIKENRDLERMRQKKLREKRAAQREQQRTQQDQYRRTAQPSAPRNAYHSSYREDSYGRASDRAYNSRSRY